MADVQRLVVLEDVDPAAAAAVAARLGSGLQQVHDAADAARAVLAAMDGGPVVVAASAPREVIDMLCDDLHRLGEVEHLIGPIEPPGAGLAVVERALLAALLAGCSLGEAARALHLSRRTADRRLAAARAALGVTSTAGALRRAAEIGVVAERPPDRRTG
ncbi:MAG: helix-turn-helix domain-containing protein [Nocardioidaceae bacterium]|nr:helix-turn-helix domain-containing protein [Nocardioidaceae bacterium]MCL2613992.1 helix-turn-helix domain-containing protein [Nocardioidaceae bacterium]